VSKITVSKMTGQTVAFDQSLNKLAVKRIAFEYLCGKPHDIFKIK